MVLPNILAGIGLVLLTVTPLLYLSQNELLRLKEMLSLYQAAQKCREQISQIKLKPDPVRRVLLVE